MEGEREREIKSVGRRESTEGERVLVDESMVEMKRVHG